MSDIQSRTADKGFLLQVPCHFVPQLQMEMLASGAPSALVVSRSATKVSLQHHCNSPLPNAASSCYKGSEPATRVVSQQCCHGITQRCTHAQLNCKPQSVLLLLSFCFKFLCLRACTCSVSGVAMSEYVVHGCRVCVYLGCSGMSRFCSRCCQLSASYT